MKKIYAILNAILITATVILCIIYVTTGGLLLKGITSSGFALLGLVNLYFAVTEKARNLRFPVWMAIGLLLSMIADVVLDIWFIPGALIFALGHICYFNAYCNIQKFRSKDLIPIAVIGIGAALFLMLAPFFDFGSSLMQIICIAYAVVISCMVGKALANRLRQRSSLNTLLAVGSILFFISDLMLVLGVFGGAPDITDTICLCTYYPAQCVLAHSIYCYTIKH